jgi:hypothetical protein
MLPAVPLEDLSGIKRGEMCGSRIRSRLDPYSPCIDQMNRTLG